MSQSVAPPGDPAGTADRDASQTLEDRYGAKKRAGFDRRFAWTTATILIALLIAFLFFSNWEDSNRVGARDLGYTISDEHSVEVRFEVTAPVGTSVACAVEALSSSKGTVGWKVVTLPPNDEPLRAVRTSLVTTTPPVTGTVSQCWELTD